MADPTTELFDLCDRNGRLLGSTKLRTLVHRDGDWHRSFHCWVVSPSASGPPQVVLQLRSPEKETWAGLWDVSVGGHYSAGEGVEGGLREIHEELGLTVALDELIYVGKRREEVVYPNGLIDREVQDIYALWREIRLESLHPDPAEVAAVALVPATDLGRLVRGGLDNLSVVGGPVTPNGTVAPTALHLSRSALVPASGNYLARMAGVAQRIARGAPLSRSRWLSSRA